MLGSSVTANHLLQLRLAPHLGRQLVLRFLRARLQGEFGVHAVGPQLLSKWFTLWL